MKFQVQAEILRNRPIAAGYYQIDLRAPQIAAAARPGQFVHVRIPLLEHRVLRRPFSIYDADPATGRLSVIYKVVGEGTDVLSRRQEDTADLLGPLGNGFTPPDDPGVQPVIVAGGYGCAATYLLASPRFSSRRPLCLFGARSREDLLLVEEFQALGCEVRTATDDGSAGRKGFVTELLRELLEAPAACSLKVFACGPNPMLKAVSTLVLARGLDAEISLDHAMCCGVGACFACVVKRKAETPDGWEYVRTCTDGPVFPASSTVWD